jgi:hypothetical protein
MCPFERQIFSTLSPLAECSFLVFLFRKHLVKISLVFVGLYISVSAATHSMCTFFVAFKPGFAI